MREIALRAGIEPVERGDNSRNEAFCLDGSAADRPRPSEGGPSAFQHRQAGELPIRTSPIEGLPPLTTKRWVVRRKAAVVAAVLSGEITVEEACRWYQLSEEEFLSWQRAFEIHGLAGLRTTRTQQYRALRAARSRSASLKQVQSSLFRRA
jgi:transposase-like protein